MIFRAAIIACVVLFVFFKLRNSSTLLHMLYEVGATADKRHRAASRIYRNARKGDGSRARELHYALDVLLCEGRYWEVPETDPLHRRYWELGHAIAADIRRIQNLNIDSFWFADSYEDARQLMKAK